MSHKISGNGSGPPVSDLATRTRSDRATRVDLPEQPSLADSPVAESAEPRSQPALGVLRGQLRRLSLAAAALASVATLLWAGHKWWTVGRYIETTDDAYVGGNVTAIAPHVHGFVAEVLARDNERVHAGQLLVKLDPRDFQAALDHATAVLAGRTTEVEGLRARYILQQSTIRQHEAELAAKAARATFTMQDAERYGRLAATNAVSRQEAQQSATFNQEARSAVSSSAAALDAARQQLKVLDAQIASARAAEAEARSDLETARLDLGYTEIRSPIEGYVSNRAAQVGAYVEPGAYLISIVPATGLWVDANFKGRPTCPHEAGSDSERLG